MPIREPDSEGASRASSEASDQPVVPAREPDPEDASRASGSGLPDGSQADEADSSERNGAEDPDRAEDHERLLERDLEELTAKAEKADEYLGLAQRTKADFENYRKRASREATLAQDRGVAKLAKELLPAIDNLDRAVQAAETFATGSPEEAAAEAESQLASGIRLVHVEVLAALARVGIEPFSPVGEAFDPQFHEAVAQQPIEGHASGTVVEVYQQGYRLGETVLRPARVLVAA